MFVLLLLCLFESCFGESCVAQYEYRDIVEREFNLEKINAFFSWLEENGFKMGKKFTIESTESEGLGLVAQEPLEPSDIVFEIPIGLTVMLDFFIGLRLDSNSKRRVNEVKEFLKLVCKKKSKCDDSVKSQLILYYERFVLKETSFYHPYFEVLPTIEYYRSNYPFYYPQKRLNRFKGTRLGEYYKKQILEIGRKLYKVLLKASSRDKWIEIGRNITINVDDVTWTLAVIYERAFSTTLPDDETRRVYYLAPVSDFRNSVPEPFNNNELKSESTLTSGVFIESEDRIIYEVVRNINIHVSQGDQILQYSNIRTHEKTHLFGANGLWESYDNSTDFFDECLYHVDYDTSDAFDDQEGSDKEFRLISTPYYDEYRCIRISSSNFQKFYKRMYGICKFMTSDFSYKGADECAIYKFLDSLRKIVVDKIQNHPIATQGDVCVKKRVFSRTDHIYLHDEMKRLVFLRDIISDVLDTNNFELLIV